jgi:hypothetical protein
MPWPQQARAPPPLVSVAGPSPRLRGFVLAAADHPCCCLVSFLVTPFLLLLQPCGPCTELSSCFVVLVRFCLFAAFLLERWLPIVFLMFDLCWLILADLNCYTSKPLFPFGCWCDFVLRYQTGTKIFLPFVPWYIGTIR